jgi:hypothetical protein
MKSWISLLATMIVLAGCGQALSPSADPGDEAPAPPRYVDGKADTLIGDGTCQSDRGHDWYNVYIPFVTHGVGPNPPSPPNTTYPDPQFSSWFTTKRVKLIVYNPILTDGLPMLEHYGWNDPEVLAADYTRAMHEATGHAVRFDIVDREVRESFPPLLNRPDFDAESYEALHDGCKRDPALCPTRACNNYDPQTCPNPEPRVDYEAVVDGLCSEVESCQVDEVWVFAGPFLGLYESRMVGDGALSINSPPLDDGCDRRYIVMGFNPERGLNSMLHDMGHMIESYFRIAFAGWEEVDGPLGEDPYDLFRRWRPGYDVQNDETWAVCGDTHWSPTSQAAAYIYNDTTPVDSICDSFYDYPDVEVAPREITCEEWGCNETGYQKWVFDHVPRSSGDFNGYPKNWWKFVFGFNHFLPPDCADLDADTCDSAPTCSWYACDDAAFCGEKGFDETLVCSECAAQGDLPACDATPGCAWYACSDSCFPTGTPLETACP